MECQDHVEIYDKDGELKYQPGAELLPAYLPPPHKFNIDDHMFLRKCSEEYAEKCFAVPHFPFVEVAAGFVLGVCLTLIIWGLV